MAPFPAAIAAIAAVLAFFTDITVGVTITPPPNLNLGEASKFTMQSFAKSRLRTDRFHSIHQRRGQDHCRGGSVVLLRQRDGKEHLLLAVAA